ncbi:MAG: RecX family transcriptional regulator [Cyclobacteriaceae bacterium]
MSRAERIKAAKNKAARYCAGGERSPKKVLEKLQQYGLEHEESEQVLADLIALNFVNEERYANAFVKDKFRFNKWGKKRIEMELANQQIDYQLIANALDEINLSEYQQIIMGLAQQKWTSLSRESDDFIKKQKTIRFLLGKGFESDLAVKTVNHLTESS